MATTTPTTTTEQADHDAIEELALDALSGRRDQYPEEYEGSVVETARALIHQERRTNAEWVRSVLRAEFDPGYGDGLDEEQRDQRHRRYLEWTVAHLEGLPPTHRLVLRVILLREDCYGRRPCTADYDTLARDASLSESQFRAILRRLAHRPFGYVYRDGSPGARKTCVTIPYHREAVAKLRSMWASPAVRVKTLARGETLAPAEDAVYRAQRPDEQLFMEEGLGDLTDEEFDTLCDEKLKEFVNRFTWIRQLVKDQTLGTRPQRTRHQRGTRARARVKGVAFAVDLLMNSAGRPFRWTTAAELAGLSGYADVKGVRRALADLEAAKWLDINRSCGHGLLICLRYPEAVAEQLRLREELGDRGFGHL